MEHVIVVGLGTTSVLIECVWSVPATPAVLGIQISQKHFTVLIAALISIIVTSVKMVTVCRKNMNVSSVTFLTA